MLHDGCYLGAMLSLGAKALRRLLPLDDSAEQRKAINEMQTHWDLARNLTETCRLSSLSLTGLPPNFLFVTNLDSVEQGSYFNEYHLRYVGVYRIFIVVL